MGTRSKIAPPPHNANKANVYEEDERHAALELAAVVGVTAAAAQLNVNRASIYRWINQYPQLWSDLRAGDPAAHKRGIAVRLEDLADRYAGAEHAILDDVEAGKISPRDAKEAAAMLKAFGSSRQAAVAGARQITGEPEQHEHHIDFPQIEAAMEALLNSARPEPALLTTNLAEAN